MDIKQFNKYQISKILIFLDIRSYICSLFSKKTGTLHRRYFWKHPLFTTFLLVFTVAEVCNISNKYYLSNKWRRSFTPKKKLILNLKKIALHRKNFQKLPLFTTFLLVLTVGQVSNNSIKYQPLSNSVYY